MSLDNPIAKFFAKKYSSTSTTTSSSSPLGHKRLRSEENTSADIITKRTLLTTETESPTEIIKSSIIGTTDAASSLISPNTEEFGGAGRSFPTELSSASPVKVMLLSDEEDDDEAELRLLLGGSNKVFVRPPLKVETKKEINNFISSKKLCLDTDSNNNIVEINKLPWSTRSNDVLKKLSDLFETQFRWELRNNSDLMQVFEPFFSDRALKRIKTDDEKKKIISAPKITIESTNAAGGYTLRSYQVEGVQFLLNKFHNGMPCILADDMGLGKTAQIASFLNILKIQHSIDGPHLIVAPLSTLTSWTRELARWAPSLRVVKYHGEKKGRTSLRTSRVNRHCVFVTTPSVFNQDRGFFRKRVWVVAIVDEAHVLKGRTTMISSVARKLNACFRLAVTGTPVHNNVGEVWSLVSFLYPSYCAYYESDDEDPVTAAEDCARLLQYIMLRRTKSSIELGIPPRIDEPTIMLTPTGVQQQLLAKMTEKVLNESETSGSHLQIHLTHQRIVCNHPLAIRMLAAENRRSGSAGWKERMSEAGIELNEASIITPSAKMIELDRMLREFKANGHRCLIFSNFTSVLDILQALCVLRGYSFERLDGSTQRVERELSMIRFNTPESACFIFLLTTTAGGVGVTLTGADTVILFDAHYNPQIDRQAADRAHRIGQTRIVRVFRLCLTNTIEERILNVALRKASLGDFIVDGGSGGKNDEASGGSISSDKIRLLFESQIQNPTTNNHNNNNNKDMMLIHQNTNTSVEEAMVEDILRVEAYGLPRRPYDINVNINNNSENKRKGGGRPTVGITHNCFTCGSKMHPLEPLYHCSVCPKAYHAECIGERKLSSTGINKNQNNNSQRVWSCPRHSCALCGKSQVVDGAVFMCTECPLSFCFDCLDARYFDLDESKTQFVHIRKTYAGMEVEGMEERRSVYYITCLHCCGLLSSSSSEISDDSESNNNEEEEEEEEEKREEDACAEEVEEVFV